jgi:hypothetical protein
MKRTMFSFLTLIVLAGLAGCAHHARHSCGKCATPTEACSSSEADSEECNAPRRRCRLCQGRGCKECCEQQVAAPAGPAIGAITYPYYTTRGPRDFLAKNPRSIGP